MPSQRGLLQIEGLRDQPQLFEALASLRDTVNQAVTRIQSGTTQLRNNGTVIVPTKFVQETSIIVVSHRTRTGTPGSLSVPLALRVGGQRFTIQSTSTTDTSTVDWILVNP